MSPTNYFQIRYPHEKLSSVVETLATHKGDIKARLRLVIGDLVAAGQPGLPEEYRDGYDRIIKALHKFQPVGGEGKIEATINKCQGQTLAKVAEEIWNLWREMDDAYRDAQR